MTEKNAGQNDSNRWEGNPDTTAFPPAGGNQQRGPWVPGNDFSGGQGSGPYTPPQFHGQEPSQGQGQGPRPGYGPPPYQQQPFPPQGPPKQTQGWVIPVVIIGVLIVLAILGTIIAGLAGWITFGGGEEEGPEVVTEVVVVPGEGEAEFEELCEFLRDVEIERAGVFPFSPEEGTKAAQMDHVDTEEAKRRAELAVDVQSDIIDAYNEAVLGEEREVLCAGFDSQAQMFFGRSYAESPEIDGRIYFTADEEVAPGTFVTVRFTGTMDGELTGEMV